jgi:4-amino-4-deoxy-L-arabinose transferase-like glycosyltransferase
MTEAAPKVAVDSWWIRWAAIGLVAALIADVLYNVNVKKGDNGGTGPMIGVGIILVIVAAVLFTVVFPRFRNDARAALITGIISVLLLGAFWSGGTPLVAAAAFGYGLRAPDATAARVGMVLAGLAAVVDIIGAIASAT